MGLTISILITLLIEWAFDPFRSYNRLESCPYPNILLIPYISFYDKLIAKNLKVATRPCNETIRRKAEPTI